MPAQPKRVNSGKLRHTLNLEICEASSKVVPLETFLAAWRPSGCWVETVGVCRSLAAVVARVVGRKAHGVQATLNVRPYMPSILENTTHAAVISELEAQQAYPQALKPPQIAN